MSTLPSGSDNGSEATTTEPTTAQSTHANSDHETSMHQLLQQLTANMTSEMVTMEQRMTSEIGTLTTRSELDVLMSRKKQETLEQMQQRDEEIPLRMKLSTT